MKTSEKPTIGEQLRQDWPLYALMLVVVVLTAALYARIPDRVPIHWNWRGEADGWAPKSIAVAIMPVGALLTHLLTVVLASIDPRNKRSGQPRGPLKLVRLATPVMLLGIHVVMLAVWLGRSINLVAIIYAACGVLFAALGNVMGRIRPNYFIGIRLPWTLENDEVWKKTHRFAGRLWFVGGCALVLTPLLAPLVQFVYFMGVLVVITVAPMVFAYREYQRLA